MSFIKTLIKRIISKLHIKPIIVFESYPDMSDNTLAVYNEMLKREYNKKYRFVWQLCDRNSKNISRLRKNNSKYYFLNYKGLIEHIMFVYYRYNADVLICCNILLDKKREKQKLLYLAHGVALKKCDSYYSFKNSENDFVLSISDYIADYDTLNLKCKRDSIIPLGFPRNDVLFSNYDYLKDLRLNSKTKIIYWLPTFRQTSFGLSVSSVSIPIIYDDHACKAINDTAKENNVIILLKPHPAQDLTNVSDIEYSNLKIIDNKYLDNNKITNYELLASSDALLTDYSSVYYDYLLCDKPIGLCWEDFEEYNEREGFVVDINYIMSGGKKIYNADDLCCFIKEVANDEDSCKSERSEIKKVIHKYIDGNSTKRVVDYIEKNYLFIKGNS